MGQYFIAVNVDKREQEKFFPPQFGEFFLSHEPDRIFYDLLRLTVAFKSPWCDNDATEAAVTASCLPDFPTEIVSHIFEEIDEIGDCFCLALTSKRCWLVGQPRMKTFILDRVVQWAGDRIICIGDYHGHGDMPPDFLSAEEEEILSEYHGDGHFDQSLMFYCDIPVSRSLQKPKDALHGIFLSTEISFINQRTLFRCISLEHPEPEILRNISKRQYVRRSAVRGMIETCPEHWRWDRVDLGHVVLSRICWSTCAELSMPYKGDLHRGVWAGDRFDITDMSALDEVDENGESVEWADVTDEVLKELSGIWLSEYGSGLGARG